MKRKIITSFLSVLLATLMLFSLFQIVPFRVLGESGSVSAHSVKIDFDSEKQPDYYSYSAGNFDGPERVNDSEHGICFKYDRLKPLHWNYNHAIALSNAEGTAPLSIGVLDTVRFSVDINAVKINDNASDIHIGIAYVTKDKEKQIAGEGNGWEGIENKADIISVKHSEIEGKGWKTLSGTFIVPAHRSDEIPYILLYQENDAGTEENEVWLDNIVIKQPTSEISGVIDFDSNAQTEFYSTDKSAPWRNITTARGELKELTGEDAEHGFVYVANSAAQRGDESNNGGFGSAQKAAAISLCNTAGTARLHPETDSEMYVKAEVKNTKPSEQNVRLAVVFDDWPGNDVGEWNKGLFDHMGRCYDIGDIDMSNTNWQKLELKFNVPEINAATETPKLVLYTPDAKEILNLEIYIDNITVESHLPEYQYYIEFDTNGGNRISRRGCFEGIRPTLPIAERDGFYFEGWYIDKDLTERYNYDTAQEQDIKLYAKWTALDSIKPEKLVTGFETEDYDNGVFPYTNHSPDVGEIIKNPVSDYSNTDAVKWLTDAPLTASAGKGCLYFDNLKHKYDGTGDVHAAAIFNSDGTNYKIVAGTRYHITCDVWYDGYDMWGARDQVTTFAITNTIPTNAANQGTVFNKIISDYGTNGKFINDPIEYGTWNTFEFYLEAPATGNLYLTMYCENGSASRVVIDNLSIIPSDAEYVSKITYYEENGTTVIGSSLGKAGSNLIKQMAPIKNGYTFNGWIMEDGREYTLSEYPDSDISLTASYQFIGEIDPDTAMDWSSPVTTGFEDTDHVRKFYGDYQNIADPPSAGLYPVFNDAANAHSGNNYFYFRRVGTWLPQGQNRRFRIYAENTPNHYIWLDKNSVYKLTYYIKVDSQTDSVSRLYTVGFHSPNNLSEYDRFDYAQYRCANDSDVSGYHKVEQFLITPMTNTILGFELWGGLLTCCIDDITVEKLDNVTVRFNSNGGSAVADITSMAMDTITEPEYPTKAGYEFAGWFTDEALSSQFDFNNTKLENDITLYAKWEQIAEKAAEPGKQYKTVIDTVYVDETVDNEITDPELDEAVNVVSKDEPANGSKKSNTAKNAESDSGFPWVLLAVIAGAILLLTAIIVAIIVVKKRRALK